MAIKISNSTIIDDGRNIVNAGVATVTSVSIGNTQVISSSRELQNIASLDVRGDARIGGLDASTVAVELGSGATGARSVFVDFTGDTTYTDFGLRIIRNAGANNGSKIINRGTGALTFQNTENASFLFSQGGDTERARIDGSGRLLVGTPSATGNFLLQTEGQAGDANAEGGLVLRRGLANASISNGNGLGTINFAGQSGGVGAQIRGVGDAQWATDDYPGRIMFSTTADGSSSPTERMRITSTGDILIGTATSTGIANQKLQVDSGAYISGNLGIGSINPQSTLAVGGTITELYNGTYWNIVSQADIGIGASQVPLNQYLGQLAFLDDFSPNGLRREGGGSDDVVVSAGGSVGVGTTNPTHKLEIVDSANQLQVTGNTSRIRVNRPTGSGTNAFDFTTAGLYDWAFGSVSIGSSDLIYRTRNDGGSTVDSLTLQWIGGNVGVKESNPSSDLHVTGEARADTFKTGVIGSQTSGILTTTATTSNQVLDSLPTATFQTARYQVSIACTGQLITAGMTTAYTSVGAITAGSGYTGTTYTNVALTGGSGNDARANVGLTTTGTVSSVIVVSPGSGYEVGDSLSATLGTVGSGFAFAVSNVVKNYQSSDVMILQSVGSAATTCDFIEYSSLANHDILGNFGADISGSNARLLITPTYRDNTIKVVRTAVTV